MLPLSDIDWADVVEAFGSTSGCLDVLLGIENPCFTQMMGQMCPTGLQLNGANCSGAGAPFLKLSLSITNGMVL